MNCDGQAGFGDINPFVLAVSNPSQWHAQYPNCNILNGDINGDGTVGFGDINPFVAMMSSGNTGASQTYTWGRRKPTDSGQADGRNGHSRPGKTRHVRV